MEEKSDMTRKISRRTFLKEAARGTAVVGAAGTSLVLQGCASRKDSDLPKLRI